MRSDYRIFPDAVPKSICEAILSGMDWSRLEEASVVEEDVGALISPESRITKVIWEDTMTPIGCIAQAFLLNINQLSGWNFVLGPMENVQIGKYEVGGHYDWHMDINSPDMNANMRKLSFSLLLNDPSEFDGGNLEFDGVTEQPEQKQGTIVIFPSYAIHRVTPVTRGVRYSAVTWVNGPAFR